MTVYKLSGTFYVIRQSDGAIIPFDLGNTDYLAYLAWLSDGNVPDPEFSPEEIAANQLATATATLNTQTLLANAQVSALQGRVDAINDAADGDYVLPAETAELPGRVTQLAAWKKYRVLVGRVSTQATWPASPVWPDQPDVYTDDTSLIAPAAV